MENLMQLCREDRVAVSLPSLRAGSLTPQLMKLIRSIRKTGFTIAPEAGSQRLRDVINKNITFDDVAATVRDAFDLGWRVIKLYFMIGLPTETQDDMEALIEMVRRLKALRGTKNRKGQINVSVATFVPKAHTPFQWEAQLSLVESRQKLEYLKKALDMPGVRVKWQHPEMSMLEGILARGDRRLAGVIEKAYQSGCRFDGWNDSFNFDLWQQALAQSGVDAGFFTTRTRPLDEALPWEHMDTGVSQNFLKEQWHASRRAELLADCRHGECHACGVCDFKSHYPRVHSSCEIPSWEDRSAPAIEKDPFAWMELTYTKLGSARFFSHLEISNIFSRAVRRAKLGVQYSQGFHPLPRISFDDPLPLGMASQGEKLRILVSSRFSYQQVVQGLNAYLAGGVRVIDGRAFTKGKKEAAKAVHRFQIDFGRVRVKRDLVGRFIDSNQWPYLRSRSKRPDQAIDLRAMVQAVRWTGESGLYLEIAARPGITARPADFLFGVLGMDMTDLQNVLVTKLYGANE
jgi:radical SAM-linked protein